MQSALGLDADARGEVVYRPVGQMPRRASDARKRIVQTALALFADRGYHETGIADILKESGVKRGTLYHYFSSKRDLGAAAIDEMARVLQEEGAARHLRADDHPIDRLLRMADELPGVVRLQSGETLTPSLAVRLGTAEAEFRERISTRFAGFLDELEAILRKGVVEGQIPKRVDPRVLSRVFLVMAEGIFFMSVLEQQQVIWEDARSWLKEYLNSLRAQAGERTDRGRSTYKRREDKSGANTTTAEAQK